MKILFELATPEEYATHSTGQADLHRRFPADIEYEVDARNLGIIHGMVSFEEAFALSAPCH
ncbi:MAG: hypothetical protein DRP37_09000 [Thermodesulfobacteriota bacterium]|nr:MAG: hypothetical protein DRP37_09000 [Thermodesulfobacteriota bacterium]